MKNLIIILTAVAATTWIIVSCVTGDMQLQVVGVLWLIAGILYDIGDTLKKKNERTRDQ